MNRWEYLVWAVLLVICLMVGVTVGQWAAPQPVVGTVRFEGVIEPFSSNKLVTLLEKARRDPTVAAVVLEMNSPGGLATSSENVFYSLLRLRAEKPVVVVIDGMAASGGYYIAAAANRIYVPASAYVGNIGTRGPRPIDPYISPEEFSTGPYKFAGGSRFDQIYQLDLIKEGFVNNVIAQRINSPVNPLKLDKSTIEEGRLYLGSEAVAVGLADLEGARTDGILGAVEIAGLRRYQVQALEERYAEAVEDENELAPPSDFMQIIGQLTENAAPDTVFMLDSRIPLPGMMEASEIQEHMLRLRNIAPASWKRTNERELPANFQAPLENAAPQPATGGQ